MCRKCISAVKAAFDFRKMCEQNDVKLREYFGQHLLTVKEDKFDVYFVDDSCNSGDASQFDTNLNAGYTFADDHTAEQKVVIENDTKMHTDIQISKVEQCVDQPRYNLHTIFLLYILLIILLTVQCLLRIKRRLKCGTENIQMPYMFKCVSEKI